MKLLRKPVIFIVGPTASGKSDWALKLAQEFNGVIVNCDSIQVYKKLDIGAAKPTIEEQGKVPHFLIDYVESPEEMTAGVYCRDFYACIEKIPEGKPIFVVGGTGFYFMAIEKGMYPVLPVSEEIKKQVEVELASSDGQQKLYQEVQSKDPAYAQKIHPADAYRIGRAVELLRSQNKTVSQIQAEFSQSQFPFPLLKIGVQWDREKLNQRIVERTQKMLEQGLIGEVQELLDQGLGSWSPLASVGYKEAVGFIENKIGPDELFDSIVISTRQLAKRQRTWFQRDKDIFWYSGLDGYDSARAQVEKFLIPFDPFGMKV